MHHHPKQQAHAAETGASLVEYALLLALISVVCMGALSYFGSSNSGSFQDSACKVANARDLAPSC